MLLTASRTRARAPRSTGLATLSPSTTALLQSRHAQQCREFSFGGWSSYFHPESQKEGRRRHRMIRYRYMESLNRNLSWDNSLRAHNSKVAMKKAMAQFAARTEARGKYANLNDVKSWSDDLSGGRPGKNIEDVERGAIDHLFNGDKTTQYDYGSWKSPLQNIRNYLHSQSAPEPVTPEDVLHATTTGNGDIDPITNRRIPKYKDLGKYGPVEDVSASKPQQEKPKYNDLGKYKPARHNEPDGQQKPTPEETSKQYDDVDKYGPVRWNEPDGQQKPSVEEKSKEYKDLHKYSHSEFDDPFTQRKLTPEEQSKFYNDLDQYKPVHWNEPDGLRKQTSEELSKDYDDLHKYGAVHWNEPDGLRKLTPEELSKDYQDLGKYGPVVWSEPDGLRRLTPEELSKNYDDLDAYSAPHTAKDSILQAHEAAQMDRTVKGKPLPSKIDIPSENLTEKYEDLDQYGPVRWNEPDGLRTLTPEELSKNYDDLHLYGAVQWNEPDGLRTLTPEEQSKQYADVPKYAPRDLSGASKRMHPEEASKFYKDLPKYHQYENGDSTARLHPEETSKQYKDLHKYAQYGNAGPEAERIHPEEASKQYKDLSKYPAAGFEEAEKTQHIHPEELTKNYQDLDNYKPSVFDSPDLVYPANPVEAAQVYKELHSYDAIEHNEPDGKPTPVPDAVVSGLKNYDSKVGPQNTENGPFTHHHTTNRFFPNLNESRDVDEVDNLTAEDIRASTLRRAEENSQMTGNFVRDFPEDFATSWSTEHSPSKSTLLPKDHAEVDTDVNTEATTEATAEASSAEDKSVEQDNDEVKSMDECFPSESFKLQPALDRQTDKLEEVEDSYSHNPQGLETSFSEECGKETLPTMEKHYVMTGSHVGDPELYKILAYDSASQTVNMAEATSTIHDESAPASPADVIIRLTNPSKFLPHFQTLEAQGYEIASGSGDVLIFRKVRPASTTDSSFFPEPTPYTPTRINPIDMMGKPAVGNFASPTGFVNYDMLEESPYKPAPPYRSSEDKNPDESSISKQKPVKEKKKRRLGRKLALGTVWIAGSAYAVGVMGEYFSTRGFESEGQPRRL
ncbi:Fc.00g079980.m01.CDS01 [Cosmosporella sp. VM-42]